MIDRIGDFLDLKGWLENAGEKLFCWYIFILLVNCGVIHDNILTIKYFILLSSNIYIFIIFSIQTRKGMVVLTLQLRKYSLFGFYPAVAIFLFKASTLIRAFLA